MLDLKFIRENRELVQRAIDEKRAQLDLDALFAADERVSSLNRTLQELQEKRNQNAKRIPKASAEKRPELIAEGRRIGDEIAALKPRQDEAQAALSGFLLLVPNIAAPDAPRGTSEADNVVVREVGTRPSFDFAPLDHVAILEKHGWADLVRIAKVAGSRSYSLSGDAVLLEQSLLRFALDRLSERGFKLTSVPSFANEQAFIGTGHFPTARDQVYRLELDEKFLTGTSEVTLNALHSGEILAESELPLKYAGISACFRREAGSAGRDVRGLIRVHQFNKGRAIHHV